MSHEPLRRTTITYFCSRRFFFVFSRKLRDTASPFYRAGIRVTLGLVRFAYRTRLGRDCTPCLAMSFAYRRRLEISVPYVPQISPVIQGHCNFPAFYFMRVCTVIDSDDIDATHLGQSLRLANFALSAASREPTDANLANASFLVSFRVRGYLVADRRIIRRRLRAARSTSRHHE